MSWITDKRMSAEDHKQVTKAVTDAERHSNAEIVTIVTDQSDHYADMPLFWAGGITLLALSALAAFPGHFQWLFSLFSAGWTGEITDQTVLVTAFVVALLKFFSVWLIMQWMPLRMLLTPRDIKTGRTHNRAMNLFRVAAEGRTKAHTGILIYVSLRERRAEIIADAAITAKIDPEAWGQILADMIDKVRQGQTGDGLAMAVRQAGELLAIHIPKQDRNPNELPDRVIEL